MKNRFAVILAAGQGTRMKSKLYKVLHPILGKPMLHYVLEALSETSVHRKVTIVGHGAEAVQENVGDQSEFAVQEKQLGTAHAVLQVDKLLKDETGTTIVVCGDTPLIKGETYKQLFEFHEQSKSQATILTTELVNPFGYGRVVRDQQGNVERIVEQKDANEAEVEINEINTGTYCFDNQTLFAALKEVNNENSQNEYYITDIIEILKGKSEKVSAYLTDDSDETIGINDRVALAQAEKTMKRRINEEHLRNGVSIMDVDNTYIGPDVTIEQDVIIYPGSIITGETHISTDAIIGPQSEIDNCRVGKGSVIRQSVVKGSKIGDNADIGPFAHIRPETTLGEHVRVGNYVEVKKANVDDHTKLPHLSYIGDATIGKNVNMGCGSVTVNFDGENKHQTVIGDNSFIGCNSNLVAPITLGADTFVAAGSTINKDVPEGALAIGRARQVNKEGYVARLHHKK